jgi:hypothetical protein
VDVDSTVWDTGACVREVVLEFTGDALDLETVYTWARLLDVYGEKTTTEIFDRVLSPETVRERRPYPHASDVLRRLQIERGIRVHFVTRYYDPEAMRPRLEPWLTERFGPEVGLTVIADHKLPVLRKLGAFGLVDDDPDTLASVADAGLWAAARIQPWNRALIAARADVHGFTDWREVPHLLPAHATAVER